MAVLCPRDRKEVAADLLQARFEFDEPRCPEKPLANCGISPLLIDVCNKEREAFDSVDRLHRESRRTDLVAQLVRPMAVTHRQEPPFVEGGGHSMSNHVLDRPLPFFAIDPAPKLDRERHLDSGGGITAVVLRDESATTG
jgi:hypothetical protein